MVYIFEGDNKIVVIALCNGNMLNASFGHLVKDTFSLAGFL